MNFSNKLKELRKKQNMTQEELGNEIFVSRSVIAKYETGRSYPNMEILERIAAFFHVDINMLISEEDNREITLSTSNRMNNMNLAFTIAMIIVSMLIILFLLLPVFEYNSYIYIETQKEPLHIYGQISLITATLKKYNPIGIITIITFVCNIAMSLSSLFLNEGKSKKIIRIINVSVFGVSLVFTLFTIVFALTYMNQFDFSMNSFR